MKMTEKKTPVVVKRELIEVKKKLQVKKYSKYLSDVSERSTNLYSIVT